MEVALEEVARDGLKLVRFRPIASDLWVNASTELSPPLIDDRDGSGAGAW